MHLLKTDKLGFIETRVVSSVSDPDLEWIRIQSGQWIRIRRVKRPTKIEISCFEELNVLFEGWRLLP
jgi:hypothetical protein